MFGLSDKVLDKVGEAIAIVRSAPGKALREVTGMRRDKKRALIEETETASEDAARNIEDKIKLLIMRRFRGILDVVEILPLKELAQVASDLPPLTGPV